VISVNESLMPAWLIAIVDDDHGVNAALGNLLRSVGYAPLAFSSAEAFLACGLADAIDCAIFDVRLTGMSGLELQEHLVSAGIRLPVIFATGCVDAAVEARAMAGGAVAFLRKPVDVDELLDHIARVLASRGAVP
jgi:FixJ family two-component response regulator